MAHEATKRVKEKGTERIAPLIEFPAFLTPQRLPVYSWLLRTR